LALLPGFCIAVHLLSVLKAWLLQGLAWLLPWTPKICAFLCARQVADCLIYMLAHVCAYALSSISRWTRLVLSGTLHIFIPTSQRAKCAQSCLHEYAHVGAIMPACICTTCYYVCVLASAIVPACACSILDTITSMCVGAHVCEPTHVHNAHVGAIMPTRAWTRGHNHSLTCMYTWAQSFLQVYVSRIQFNQVISVHLFLCSSCSWYDLRRAFR
jgi:hypothetical protein